jgi:hypothetical protein
VADSRESIDRQSVLVRSYLAGLKSREKVDRWQAGGRA